MSDTTGLQIDEQQFAPDKVGWDSEKNELVILFDAGPFDGVMRVPLDALEYCGFRRNSRETRLRDLLWLASTYVATEWQPTKPLDHFLEQQRKLLAEIRKELNAPAEVSEASLNLPASQPLAAGDCPQFKPVTIQDIGDGYSIKHDLLRPSKQWTALGPNGRLSDVETLSEALDAVVRDRFQNRGENSESSDCGKHPLHLREGGWYRRRDGQVVGPAVHRDETYRQRWRVDGESYWDDGIWNMQHFESSYDLIAEVPDPSWQPHDGGQ